MESPYAFQIRDRAEIIRQIRLRRVKVSQMEVWVQTPEVWLLIRQLRREIHEFKRLFLNL
jgi:hypothetical protein